MFNKKKKQADTNSTAKNKVKIKEKILIKKEKLQNFIEVAIIGELAELSGSNLIHKFVNGVKVFVVATRKFLIDDCLTKASSTAYTVIVSLIPTLTVVITFYSATQGAGSKKLELFGKISQFMAEHNIKLNIDFILEAISGLVDNAASIGGIGAVVMVFSATAMLRSLEKSLNEIFRVKKARPLVMKIIFYWAALTLGPLMMFAGTTVASKVTAVFSSSNYNSAYVSKSNETWVVGDSSNIIYSKTGSLKFKKIKKDVIDFDNQKYYLFNKETRSFNRMEDKRLEAIDMGPVKYTDIQFIGKSGWIIGSDGIILHTTNNGKLWSLQKWDNYTLNDIHMISNNTGFIASNNGLFLTTINGGKTWVKKEWDDILSNFNSIVFYKNKGIVTGTGGIILHSNDYGTTWAVRKLNAAKRKKKFVDLNSASFVDTDNIWIAASKGLILNSNDGGTTWKSRKFMENNYYSIHFFNNKKGVIAGSNGIIIHTDNSGENWIKKEMPTYKVNKLLFKNKKLYAIGDTGLVMISTNQGKKWKGIEGKGFIAILLNFFAPFAFIWLLFVLAYIALPNTKIPFKAASIGAAFTGTVWVLFILLFIYYVKSFAKGTFAVYGALASIPLFLLMVYASIVIILYGAEVAYTLMHPATYGNIKKALKGKEEIHVFYGIAILHFIYKKFENGKGATSEKEVLKITNSKEEEINYFIKLFLDENLIIQKSDEYIPANSSKNITLNQLIDIIYNKNFEIPGPATNLKSEMKELFSSVISAKKKIMGNISLNDLIIKC